MSSYVVSVNGLSHVQWQTIAWTNPDLLFIETLGTNFREVGIENVEYFIYQSAFEYAVSEMASILSRP